MTVNITTTKKQLNRLLTLGTLMLSNKELVKLVGELRENHKSIP